MTIKIASKLIISTSVLLSLNANAAVVVEQQAHIKLNTEFHSNIDFSQNRQSVWVYNAIPSYAIDVLDGTNTWFGNVSLNVFRSSNDDVAHKRDDPSGKIGWRRELEKGSIGLDASYSRTSTRLRQFKETGLVSEDGTDTTRTINANWSRLLSDQLNLTLGLGYEQTDFGLANGGDSTTFNDTSRRYLLAELTYNLSDSLTPYARVGINDLRTDERFEYQNYLVGTVVNLSPKFSIDGGIGVTHDSSHGDNDWIGLIKADYAGERYKLGSHLSRSVLPTTLGLELYDEFNINYGYELSEKSRWGATMTLAQAKKASAYKTQDVLAFYDYDLTQSWMMGLFLRVRNIKSEGDDSANDNSAGITLTYITPKF